MGARVAAGLVLTASRSSAVTENDPTDWPPMPIYPLKQLDPARESVELYDRWLGELSEALERGDDRWELCRTVLTGIFHPELAGADLTTLPLAAQVALAQMDARNVTLEPEYYAEVDVEKFT